MDVKYDSNLSPGGTFDCFSGQRTYFYYFSQNDQLNSVIRHKICDPFQCECSVGLYFKHDFPEGHPQQYKLLQFDITDVSNQLSTLYNNIFFLATELTFEQLNFIPDCSAPIGHIETICYPAANQIIIDSNYDVQSFFDGFILYSLDFLCGTYHQILNQFPYFTSGEAFYSDSFCSNRYDSLAFYHGIDCDCLSRGLQFERDITFTPESNKDIPEEDKIVMLVGILIMVVITIFILILVIRRIKT